MVSCTEQLLIKNEKKGQLQATVELNHKSTKSFLLDKETPPMPYYIQMVKDSLGKRQLTFLNHYNNSIYFYRYDDLSEVKKISFEKEGPNEVNSPMGYFIKNEDSIYLYSKLQKILLVDELGKVKNQISVSDGYNRMSLNNQWGYIYPEFYVETVTPFIEGPDKLLLTGQFSGDIFDDIIDGFQFTAHVDYGLNAVNYTHNYPKSIFGGDVNWGEGLFMEVFPALHHSKRKMVYSFPTSHNLFVVNLNDNEYDEYYGGSNYAEDIISLDKKSGKASVDDIKSSFVKQDMYSAIIYDEHRKIYYRFLRKGLPNAPLKTSWKDKEIAVIMLDEEFNYLGETVLGTERNWHWQNSFVTEEGLNIEYVDEEDIDEQYLSFKIFVPENKI